MGLFSKKPATPPAAPAAQPPAAPPANQAPSDAWKTLREARDFLDPRPSLGTHDVALVERAEDRKLVITAFPDGAGASVQEIRSKVMQPRGQDAPPSGAWVAVHLPLAKADLWMRLTPTATALAIRAPGQAPQNIASSDPRLKELPAADAAKGTQPFFGGLYTFDAAKVKALIAQADRAWPAYPPARRVEAMLLRQAGDASGALAAAQALVRKEPGDAEAHYFAADLLDDAGRLPEALQAYDAAVRADPRLEAAWRDRGALLSKMGRPADALASYGKALELDAGSPATRSNAAIACYRSERMPEAIGHISAMDRSRVRPGDRPHEVATGLLSEWAQAAVGNEAWAAGASILGLWQEFEPLNPQAAHALGVCHANLGQRDQAVKAFRDALAKDPSYEKPRAALAKLGVKA